MGLMQRFNRSPHAGTDEKTVANGAGQPDGSLDVEKGSREPVRLITPRTISMGLIVSMGGFIFGYDTGSPMPRERLVEVGTDADIKKVKYLAS